MIKEKIFYQVLPLYAFSFGFIIFSIGNEIYWLLREERLNIVSIYSASSLILATYFTSCFKGKDNLCSGDGRTVFR